MAKSRTSVVEHAGGDPLAHHIHCVHSPLGSNLNLTVSMGLPTKNEVRERREPNEKSMQAMRLKHFSDPCCHSLGLAKPGSVTEIKHRILLASLAARP
jgi:hypothetical protein